MKALKIQLKITNEGPSLQGDYNPDYAAKILENREQAKNGQVTRVKKKDLKEFLGL